MKSQGAMTGHEYAQKRADETGRAYIVYVCQEKTDGPAMLDCRLNRRGAAALGYRSVKRYAPLRRRAD